MARMSLDTAIRLSAEVKGGGNIDRVKKSLQDLGKNSQVSAREMRTLRAATFQFARANDSTIAGIRSSIGAFRGLQEQAKIGSREFQRYGAEIQRLEAKLRGLDGTAKVAGRSLAQQLATGLAAAGIGRGLQQITMQAGQFDAELRRAAAIEGGAGSFGVLREEIERVAAAAAGTPTEVAALATALSRAGFSAQETSQALAGMVRGAEATSISFEEMGSIAADNLRAFGLQTTETGRVVDVLTQTANKSNQTVLDLGESMKYSAPIARNLGVPLEDLAATMALLANNGIRGSDAGTALRTGLTRLQIAASGSNEELEGLTRGNVLLARAMRSLGAEIIDTQGNLLPLDQVILSLRENLQSMSTGRRAEIAKALFGDEAGSKFLALMNSSEEQITKMFNAVRNSGGVAEETQKKMQGFDYSIKVLGGNVQNVTNQIGGMIGTALKPLVDGLNAALGEAQKLPEPIKAFGSAAAAAGITTLGLAVAINAVNTSLALFGGVSGIKAGIAGLLNFKAAAALATKAAAALNLAVLVNPWVLAAAGIVAATAAAYKFIEPFREFVNSYPERFKIFWGSIAADAQASFKRITDAATAMGQFLAKGVQNIANIFATMFGWIRDRAGEALRAIGVDGEWLAGAMQGVSTAIGNMFSAAFDFIQSSWRQTVSNMINYSNPLTAMLKGMGIDVGAAATSALAYQPAASRQERMFGSPATGAVPSAGAGSRVTALPVIPAAAMPSPTTGGGTSGRAAAAGPRTDQNRAIEQLRQEREAVQRQYEAFNEQRAQSAVQLLNEKNLMAAIGDEQRRRLELDIEIDNIAEQHNEKLRDLKAIEDEVTRLRGVGEFAAIRAGLEREKEQRTALAQARAEQDINDLVAERVRMMQQLITQAAESPAFQTQGMRIEAQIATLKGDLAEMTSIATVAGRSAEVIGGAFGNAFRDLISGAASARQVLSGFFEDVAQGFAQMASEIIAKQMAMVALQSILRALGAVSGGGSTFTAGGQGGSISAFGFDPSGFTTPSTGIPFSPRALGGPVSPGRPYPVGERGPELFVPYQAGSIVPAEATEALQAINNASMRGLQVPFQGSSSSTTTTLREVPFQRGMEGLAVPFQRGGDAGGGTGGGGSWDSPIRFESVVINSEELVTRKQAEEIGRRSEQRGAALAQKRMVNNPTTRRQAGIG